MRSAKEFNRAAYSDSRCLRSQLESMKCRPQDNDHHTKLTIRTGEQSPRPRLRPQGLAPNAASAQQEGKGKVLRALRIKRRIVSAALRGNSDKNQTQASRKIEAGVPTE